MTLAPVDQSDLDKRDAEKLGKHEISVRDFGAGAGGPSGGPIVGGFWEETQTTKRDKASQALCAQCGKPGEDLAKCGGCRLVRCDIGILMGCYDASAHFSLFCHTGIVPESIRRYVGGTTPTLS